MSKFAILATLALGSVFASSLDANAAAGRTSGAFAVSGTGAANYTIPIWAPPGIQGIQPHLALTYSSHQEDGYLGVGWNIAGLSSIYRCNRTVAQDGVSSPVTLTHSDVFCMDGNRLRLTSGAYGVAGSTYQTEVADFSLVTANATAGNGPATFTVRRKDGLIYSYGTTAGSQVIATGASTASSWMLSEVADRSGNTMTIAYQQATGSAVPDTISWASNADQGVAASHKIVFNYGANVLQSVKRGYAAGTVVENAKLLGSIYVQTSAGTTLRSYFLGYEQAAATGRSLLNQVKECADTSQSDCYLPTTLSYQEGQAGLSSSGTTIVLDANDDPFYKYHYDVNGDGFADLILMFRSRTQSGYFYYHMMMGSANGFGAQIDTGISLFYEGGVPFPRFVDLLGTGKTGLVMPSATPGDWTYNVWNGTTFAPVATFAPPINWNQVAGFADINGDGLPDAITSTFTYDSISNNGTLRVYAHLNSSSGGNVSFGSASEIYNDIGPYIVYAAVGMANGGEGGPLREWDFNGDGREDLLLSRFYWGGDQLVPTTPVALFSTSSGSTPFYLPNPTTFTANSRQFVNWNNDACTDIIDGGHLFLSGCDGSMLDVPLPVAATTVLDWDGDGRQDLLFDNGGALGVYISTGEGVGSLVSTSIPTGSCSTASTFAKDTDGDGLDDLVCWLGSFSGSTTIYQHNSGNLKPDLLASVTDGYGVNFNPTYVPITQSNYSKYTDSVYPNRDFVDPLYVVNQFTASDGIGGTYSQSFWYYGAQVHLQGRGFQGFDKKRTIDSRNGLHQFQYFRRDFPFTGALRQVDVFQTNGTTLINSQINTFNSVTLGSLGCAQCYFPFISQSSASSYEIAVPKNGQLVSTSTTTYTYDNYGNTRNVSATVTDNDAATPASPYVGQSWTSTTSIDITPDTSNWCLGLPTSVSVTKTAPGTTQIVRRTDSPSNYLDYAKCRVTGKVVEPTSSQYMVTEAYGFDAFGNPNSVTTTGAGMTARNIGVNWGATGRFVMSTTNALNQSTQFGYDFNFGLLTSITDPNNIQSSSTYDSFGRKLTETRPDGTYTTYIYTDCALTVGCLVGTHGLRVVSTDYNSDGSVRSDGEVLLDPFDRPLVDIRRNLSGGYTRNEVRYDPMGRVQQRFMPCVSSSHLIPCPYASSYSYDALNRLKTESRPINTGNSSAQTTTLDYLGRTTVVTDAEGKTTTKITHVAGLLGRSQDHTGYYQNFTYDAFGSVKSVTDSLSNTLMSASYVYGIGAFQTAKTDMDMGTWGYTPNALGEVVAYTDANGAVFSMTYDDLSRPKTRAVSGEGTTTWTWGASAANFNIGQLESVTSVGGTTESFTYDNKGRTTRRRIVSDASYDYDYAYHATSGDLDTLTYPTSTAGYRLKLQYNYQSGILNQVKDFNSATVFWQGNAINSRGQVTQETFGNGLVTNRSFDAITGWINSIQCGPSGNACAQNQSYLFDKVGNMIQRQNNNLGLTENFHYDNLYRLDYSQLNGVTNLDMAYDAMGNITSKSDVAGGATWTYSATRKHQVTQAGNSSYTYGYDFNGNATTRNGQSITWNKFNYPTVINGNGESTTLSYDANHARWRQVYVRGGVTETTIYVGDKLEKVSVAGVDNYRHYISAGGGTVAVMSRTTTGINATRYLLHDAIGSVSKISDNAGANVVSESFTAFGARRNPATWTGSPTNGDLVTSEAVTMEGYTGHDVLGRMGLNHMNGRVQDAITGRFLSADPFITDAGNTQNYNRYSYVMNNPLSYIDPTGFDLEEVVVTGQYDECHNNVIYRSSCVPFSVWDLLLYYGSAPIFPSWVVPTGGGPSTPETTETPPAATEPPPPKPQEKKPPCTASAAASSNDSGYKDYLAVSVGGQVSPFIVGGSYSNLFLWEPNTSSVLHYWSVSGGPGLGLSAGGGLQVGAVGLNSPSDITGFGIQASGFLAWDIGVAGTAFGGTGNVGIPGGAKYSGGTAGLVAGAGASAAAEISFTKFVGKIDFSKAPQNVQSALCKANGQ